MITVKVLSESTGKPVNGKKVQLGLDGNWLPGGMSSIERSNSQGEAHFNNDPAKGRVIVEGRIAYEGELKGRVVVYV